jgi:hypothetical protein
MLFVSGIAAAALTASHSWRRCNQQAHPAVVWRSIAQGYEHDECSKSPKGDRVCTKKRVWFVAFDNRTVVSVPGFGDAHCRVAVEHGTARLNAPRRTNRVGADAHKIARCRACSASARSASARGRRYA